MTVRHDIEHRVVAGQAALAALIDRLRDRLAQDVEPALEIVLGLRRAAADEHLHVVGFGRLDGFAERGIVGRHVAPAEQHQAFCLDRSAMMLWMTLRHAVSRGMNSAPRRSGRAPAA